MTTVQQVENVNEAYYNLKGLVTQSPDCWRQVGVRGMSTLEWKGVFVTDYLNPCERVLLDEHRDANPFFHFFESLWILASRNDVKYLTQFNSRMAEFSDDGEVFHGAYGYRLRRAQGFDQIFNAIELLRKEPSTRRAVLQIWDARLDLGMQSRDIPCNDLLMLDIRDERLNMAICCRSNDALWGAYGANAVQFSVLQEFIARAIDVQVGTMTQISRSFHVYNEREDFTKLADTTEYINPYASTIRPFPIMERTHFLEWLAQCEMFTEGTLMKHYSGSIDDFFTEVAMPMLNSWQHYKNSAAEPDKGERVYKAVAALKSCAALDWRIACEMWLTKRMPL